MAFSVADGSHPNDAGRSHPIGANAFGFGRKAARQRFEVTMNSALADDLQKLADEADVSRTEIFKRAIAAYVALKTNEDRGYSIVLKDSLGAEQRLITP